MGSRQRTLGGPSGGPVRFRTTFRNSIHDFFRGKGWIETESETEWDVAWIDKDWIRENFMTLSPGFADHQRINHFPNHFELTRKDNLIKNLKRTQRALLREGLHEEASRYDFFPGTYVLPADYGLFVEEFKNHPTGTIWIMKPTGSAQGKGIFLFTKLSAINEWKKDHTWKNAEEAKAAAAYVVQRYIENPQLIGGKKFDLRLYVLVTSYAPLTVYMYRNGFARFSSYRYNTNAKNLGDTFVHLTNVAVQKTGPGFDAGAGSKWLLRNYRLFLVGKYGHQATDKMFADVEELVINTLLSVQKVMISDKHCFEMYGYDILIDDQLKPWLIEVPPPPHAAPRAGERLLLDSIIRPAATPTAVPVPSHSRWLARSRARFLVRFCFSPARCRGAARPLHPLSLLRPPHQVNASPSISADTMQDYDLKVGLLEDVYTVLDVEGKMSGPSGDGSSGAKDSKGNLEPTVGGYDLIYHGGWVKPDKVVTYTSKLGCFDEKARVRSLKKLYASHGMTYKPPRVDKLGVDKAELKQQREQREQREQQQQSATA